MKKILFLFCFLILVSCQENGVCERKKIFTQEKEHHSMQRLIVSSRSELKKIVGEIGDLRHPLTRALLQRHRIEFSDGDENFVSLAERQYQHFMKRFTPEEISIIKNDPEGLEYCPDDSVIADLRYAQLLNANREIQIQDTIFKYTKKGVAYTVNGNDSDLSNVEKQTQNIKLTPDNIGKRIRITPAVIFIPVNYKEVIHPSQMQSSNNADSEGIRLADGTYIPKSDIRFVDYNGKNDGGFFQKISSSLFGKDVVAINKFSSHRRLRLNLYHQNYLIYSSIATKLNMQKKVLGIWWNIKADELVQGWETVTLKYTFPASSLNYFIYNGTVQIPNFMYNPFPFGHSDDVLFHIPYINYDFTTEDVNKAFQSGLKYVAQKAIGFIKDKINGTPKEKLGLFTEADNDIYVMFGPYSHKATRCSSLKDKLFAKWFPGTYAGSFGISEDGGIKNWKIRIQPSDHVRIFRASVYGVVKYKGKWLGARIYKNS